MRGRSKRLTVRQAVGDLRQQLLRATMEGASPFIADVLVHHTNPKKLDHLRSRMAERNAERRRALEEPLDVRIESKIESAISRFERFFGELHHNKPRPCAAISKNGRKPRLLG